MAYAMLLVAVYSILDAIGCRLWSLQEWRFCRSVLHYMNESPGLNREQLLKRRKFLIVILAACFIAGPVFFWKEIGGLRPMGIAIFIIGYFVIYAGLFWFYGDRYRKARAKTESP